MDLRLGLLAAALFLSSSALTPEECKPLLEPQSLGDVSEMYGKWYFHAGFIKNELFHTILEKTSSSWMNVSLSDGETVVTQHEKLNGSCLFASAKVHMDGDTVRVSVPNITSEFHVLHGCDSCLIMNINSTVSHQDKLAEKMGFHINATAEQVSFPAVYLFAREASLKDSDLEHFKQQAGCLGFTGELDFHYDPKNDFCAEGEGVRAKF